MTTNLMTDEERAATATVTMEQGAERIAGLDARQSVRIVGAGFTAVYRGDGEAAEEFAARVREVRQGMEDGMARIRAMFPRLYEVKKAEVDDLTDDDYGHDAPFDDDDAPEADEDEDEAGDIPD